MKRADVRIGTKQTLRDVRLRSAFGSKADNILILRRHSLQLPALIRSGVNCRGWINGTVMRPRKLSDIVAPG